MRISRGKSDSLVKFNYKIDGMRGLILAVTHRNSLSEKTGEAETVPKVPNEVTSREKSPKSVRERKMKK